jgi:hypothetical protein
MLRLLILGFFPKVLNKNYCYFRAYILRALHLQSEDFEQKVIGFKIKVLFESFVFEVEF